MQHVIFDSETGDILDIALFVDGGRTVIGACSGASIKQLRANAPTVKCGTVAAAYGDCEQLGRSTPVRCSAERYEFALSEGPHGWCSDLRGESFKSAAYLVDSCTRIYARVADTYWTFCDSADYQHNEIMARIEALLWADATTL